MKEDILVYERIIPVPLDQICFQSRILPAANEIM